MVAEAVEPKSLIEVRFTNALTLAVEKGNRPCSTLLTDECGCWPIAHQQTSPFQQLPSNGNKSCGLNKESGSVRQTCSLGMEGGGHGPSTSSHWIHFYSTLRQVGEGFIQPVGWEKGVYQAAPGQHPELG